MKLVFLQKKNKKLLITKLNSLAYITAVLKP